jgi:thiol-disulfide isomerase/thioredoxin
MLKTTRWVGMGIVAVALVSVYWLSVARAQDKDTTALKGQPAPEVAVKTLDGKDVKLSEQKGNVVMMDFWATWCGPCKQSLPHVQELSKDADRAAKGLKVWAVNSAEDAKTVEAFVKKNNYTFTVPLAGEDLMKTYMVTGIPATVIVGRDGKVAEVFVGFDPNESPAQLKAALDKALAAKGGPTS